MTDELKDLRDMDLPFDVDDVIPQCHQCIRDQLEKYKNHIDSEGNPIRGRFIVPCNGIRKNIIDPATRAQLTDDQIEEVEAVKDIVKFAKKYLRLTNGDPWDARWYQKQVLRCSSKRKCLRISRRTGKCISQQSCILTETGPMPARDFYGLVSRPKVLSFRESDQKIVASDATIKDNGVQEVFKLTTKNGRENIITGNHPFLVRQSLDNAIWKELKDLDIGDQIAVPSTYRGLIKGVSVGARKARLLGYLIGNGGTNYKFDAEGISSLAIHKEVPKSILRGTEEDIVNFLGAYWDCGGWASVNKSCFDGSKQPNVEVGVCSASKDLALGIKHLLLRLGIFVNIRKKRIEHKEGHQLAWQITMAGKDSIEKFYQLIPLKVKQKKLKEVYEIVKDRKARAIKEEYFWDPIVSIVSMGNEETYDLTVPETHTLIVDDIISHNTDSVCVEICYYLFTNNDIKILITGPQKTHVEEIITRVRAFIRANPALSDSVEKDISAPYYQMTLKNGSRLRGIPAGTKGKTEGIAIRGQDADRIYVEEMQYVDNTSLRGAVLPILFTNPETTLVGFSTPSGFRTTFYDLCENSPQYKEFHYNYKVLPWWKHVELERDTFTEEEWIHEQLAEWGTSESGVYKPAYIDRALTEYRYDDLKRNSTWKYTIGTDWNEKYGTEIAVVGYDPFSTTFKIVETVHIERSEFTQLTGVTKLLEMNKKWRPSFIYIDAGNGCLHADSLVLTEDGSKLIKDIQVGDKVLTYNGEYKPVHSIVCTGVKESYSIKPTFCLPTIASKEHLHVVYDSTDKFNDFPKNNIELSLKSTDELNTDKDFFVITKQDTSKMKTSCFVDLTEELKEVDNLEYNENYIWTKHGYCTDQKLSVSEIIKEFNTSRPTVQRTRRKAKTGEHMSPAEVRLFDQLTQKYDTDWISPKLKKTERFIDICDPEFLYIYGWYLSEGSIGQNSIEISQMPHHYQEEFDRLIAYCEKRWDINILIRSHGKQKGMKRLFIQNSLISKLFEKIGGKYCYNKFIDKRIMQCNPIELLPSLFYGDGHIRQYGVDMSLTSFTLVNQTRQILANNGLLAGLHKVNSRKRKDGYKDSLPQLMLYLNAKDSTVDRINNLLEINIKSRGGIQRRKYIETDKYFLVPIRKVKYIGESDDMYDLTVVDNASFCANGFITHNSTNFELLRKTAYDNSVAGGDITTAKLLTILKKYDAGAAIEIHDPVTRQKRKSPAKSFMVNSSVRMFEQNKIRISTFDTKLDAQLRNYIIDRYTPTGNPVYGLNDEKTGDHRLDAVNLAIVAFDLEFSDLHAKNLMTDIAIAPNPRSQKYDDYDKITDNRPHSRDMDGEDIKNDFEKQLFPMAPGHIDNGLQGIRTNRPGWSTDEEDVHIQKFLHKRRSPSRNKTNRPNRTKF